MTEKNRNIYIRMPEMRKLEHFCRLISSSMKSPVFVVGSCLARSDYNDVDIRAVMGDGRFEELFGDYRNKEADMLWSLLCTSVSIYASQQTGLPIDFQVQSEDEQCFHAGHPKLALTLWNAPSQQDSEEEDS